MTGKLKDMAIGEAGWTVPWAMYVDDSGDWWLNGEYTVDQPVGTFNMRVSRTSSGFVVDVRKCGYTWNPGSEYFGNFVPLAVFCVVRL